jgi:hypothetical protein
MRNEAENLPFCLDNPIFLFYSVAKKKGGLSRDN